MDLARLGAFPPCPQVLAASELDSQQTDIDRSDEALSIVARTGPLRHAPVGDSQAPLTGHNDRDCSLSWLSHSLPPIGCGQGATGGTGGPGCRPHERPSTAMLRRECGRNYRVGRFCDRQPLVGISGERFWTEELCHPVVPRVAEPVPRQATFVLSSNGTSAMLLATAPQGFWGTCCGIPASSSRPPGLLPVRPPWRDPRLSRRYAYETLSHTASQGASSYVMVPTRVGDACAASGLPERSAERGCQQLRQTVRW